ncbi:MAG TPA: CRISPR-associated protein Cas4 [bacterium]|nr:CRISPR-associated protein Cas4 [bacterium]
MEFKIIGTFVWYYFICKREVWFMAHNIQPSQENPYIEIGRLISEEFYPREKKEIKLESMIIDIIKCKDGQLLIGEVKKSSKYLEAAKMQLLFYLYQLKEKGVEAKGELLIPKEKKRIEVVLNEENERKLLLDIEKIKNIISQNKLPEKVKNQFCRNCAYDEFCWS